jgi:hypothetical protein
VEETGRCAVESARVSGHPAAFCSRTFSQKIKTLLWYQMLEITATLAAGELKNAREHEDEHEWFLVLVNWQHFLYIAKSI